MKNLIKKFFNNQKADLKAVTGALDIASGGYLSLVSQSVQNVYRGYLQAKFDNLIIDTISNDVSKEELLDFIESASDTDRGFISNLILKNMQADNRLTTFLLAKLWTQKIKNGELNYYESSLLTNINTLTDIDYGHVWYILKSSKVDNEGVYFLEIDEKHSSYSEVTIEKLKHIGILRNPPIYMRFGETNTANSFKKNDYTDQFFNYIEEFYASENV